MLRAQKSAFNKLLQMGEINSQDINEMMNYQKYNFKSTCIGTPISTIMPYSNVYHVQTEGKVLYISQISCSNV